MNSVCAGSPLSIHSLFLICSLLISEASSPKFLCDHLRNFWTHLNLLNFSPIHPHPSSSLKLHPHPFTLTDSSSPSPILTDSPSPILKSFWVWVQILQKRSSVGVGGFSSVGVGANCKVGFD